ncbi:MAG: universal stress protein [Deltaproteobacteria bacterium]|nr:universal stress protein [Deltaproteobacteria bacterium]
MGKKSRAAKSKKECVLVPVDFSERSRGAVRWAAAAARCFDLPLLLLHVAHDPGAAPGYYTKAKKRRRHLLGLEAAARLMLDEFLAEIPKEIPELEGLEVNDLLIVGLPVSRILEVAERHRARLIVMGSQGRTGLPHLMLGSKAERVVQLAKIPVTIVKEPVERQS